MKWKNIDAGPGRYYITATFTEWLPLLKYAEIRQVIIEEIEKALDETKASLSAFVLMPDHLHLLVYLPEEGLLHKFIKLWRGRSARRIIDLLILKKKSRILDVLSRHARSQSKYALWKEQVRALAVSEDKKGKEKMEYIHANPVRRGLVNSPEDWKFSSFRFYEYGEDVILPVKAIS